MYDSSIITALITTRCTSNIIAVRCAARRARFIAFRPYFYSLEHGRADMWTVFRRISSREKHRKFVTF